MTGARRAAVGLLLALVVVGTGLWLFQDEARDLLRGLEDGGAAPGEVSADRATRVEDRIRTFAAGEGPDSLILATADLQSLIRYRSAGSLPPGVEDPDVVLADSTALVRGILVPADLPAESGGGSGLQGLLGDSTELRAEVVPGLVRTGVAEVRVRQLEAGDLSLPSMLVPAILRQSGLPVEKGRPRSIVFAVPDRLEALAVRDSQLVLRRAPPGPGGP